ncbi:MAG: hypothetical protein H0X20_02295 [Chloroflexi bacterium]|nr:hypothetical protein [Chloroflexota bacterium]MBA3796042.1 hypothetical protein [Chloroflexota bacterium]
MILVAQAIGEYVSGLAKATYSRGFELPANPIIEIDRAGFLSFSISGSLPDPAAAESAEISLDEIWRPLPGRRRERREYTYDVIDRPRRRRLAFHLHDRDLAEATFGVAVHEHCEETLGDPACAHYLGRELPDGYLALELLMAAWVEPDALGCERLRCLE